MARFRRRLAPFASIAFALTSAGCGGAGTAPTSPRSGDASCAVQTVPANAARAVRCLPVLTHLGATASDAQLAVVAEGQPNAMPGFKWPDERFVARFGPTGDPLPPVPVGFTNDYALRKPLVRATGDAVFLANGVPRKPIVRIGADGARHVTLDEGIARAMATIAATDAAVRERALNELSMAVTMDRATREATKKRLDEERRHLDALLRARPNATSTVRAMATSRSGVAVLVDLDGADAILSLDTDGKVRWATLVEREQSTSPTLTLDARGDVYLYGVRSRGFTSASPFPVFDRSTNCHDAKPQFCANDYGLHLIGVDSGFAIVGGDQLGGMVLGAQWFSSTGQAVRVARSKIVLGPSSKLFGAGVAPNGDLVLALETTAGDSGPRLLRLCRVTSNGDRCVDLKVPDGELFGRGFALDGEEAVVFAHLGRGKAASGSAVVIRVSVRG